MGGGSDRVCAACGRDPSLGVASAPVKTKPTVSKEAEAHDDDSMPSHDQHRKRQKKSGGSMIFLVIGWSIVMAGIVLFANRWKGRESRRTDWTAPAEYYQLTPEDNELLRKNAGACQIVIGNVLSHSTPEQISAYVFNRRDTFLDMIRFYQTNPGTQMLETRIDGDGISVIQLPDGPAIEGRWKTEDGRVVDAVFRRQEKEWLLDWHHFARYSEFPWGLFLAGDGPDEAEFRLLVRQRLSRQTLDYGDLPLSLVFHAPRFGRPDEPGPPSPVFELEWDSDAARMLIAGFNQVREGRRPFRALLPTVETDDEMMRVRVVVRRIDEDNDRRFEIVEVRACHWIQVDDPGVSLDELNAAPDDPDAIDPQ